MSQGNSIPRVSGGVPWWLWLVALLATAAVVLGIVADQDEETADDIFARAELAIDAEHGLTVAECLESLERLDEADDRVAILKGIMAGATDRDPRSVQILEPFLDHPNARYKRLALKFSARAYQKIGNSDRARELHEQYAAIDPSDVSPHLLLMRLYMDAGALQPAKEAASAVLELEPDNRDAKTNKAMIQAAIGEEQEAKQLYADLLQTEGDRAAASPETVENYVTLLLNTDETDAAVRFTRENESLLTDPAARFELYLKSDQLDKAVEVLRDLKLEPDNPLFVQVRGLRAINDGNWELAVGLLSQVVLAMPRSVSAFEQLELSATNNNQVELAQACRDNLEAIHQLEQQMETAVLAIGDDMADPDLRLRVVDLAEKLGRPGEARQWVNSAATVAPGRQIEILKRRENLLRPDTPIVPIGAAFTGRTSRDNNSSEKASSDEPGAEEPAPNAAESTPAPTEDSAGETTESADEGGADDESSAPEKPQTAAE